MMSFALLIMLVISAGAFIIMRFRPSGDEAQKKQRYHFLLGFLIGQGFIWTAMIFSDETLALPFVQKYELVFSLFLFFMFLGVTVSLMDD